MKKRSLVSAIAMLVVSALVLTTATFAWFASGDEVGVDEITASISNSGGSLLISVDQSNWKTQITRSDLASKSTNTITDTFSPISVQPSTLGMVSGSIEDGISFKANGTISGKYIDYTVYVKSDVDMDAIVTPTVALGTSFVYAYIKVASEAAQVIGNHKYYPVINNAATATDANGNNIVDDATHDAYALNGENAPEAYDTDITAGSLGAQVTPTGTSASSQTISLTANSPVAIRVIMWAEGQDINCRGNVTAANNSVALKITKAGSTEPTTKL